MRLFAEVEEIINDILEVPSYSQVQFEQVERVLARVQKETAKDIIHGLKGQVMLRGGRNVAASVADVLCKRIAEWYGVEE